MEGLQRVTFERWLELFYESVDKYYEKEAADIFKARSKSIADSFMKLLGL
ncbi:MAG: hypothetical protein U9O86_09910 [Campylobacterota bacterium]|nr:hypothetical protein [Campylobacterota bacterium]